MPLNRYDTVRSKEINHYKETAGQKHSVSQTDTQTHTHTYLYA